MRSTYTLKASEIKRDWYVADAEGQTLGRLASQVAHVLRGKHKPIFTPHLDTGDYVVIINAEKFKVTGKKLDQKIYKRHSGYVGHLKTMTLRRKLDKSPTEILYHAVKGMLPKNAIGKVCLRKLRVIAGPEHPYAAQKPQPLEIKY